MGTETIGLRFQDFDVVTLGDKFKCVWSYSSDDSPLFNKGQVYSTRLIGSRIAIVDNEDDGLYTTSSRFEKVAKEEPAAAVGKLFVEFTDAKAGDKFVCTEVRRGFVDNFTVGGVYEAVAFARHSALRIADNKGNPWVGDAAALFVPYEEPTLETSKEFEYDFLPLPVEVGDYVTWGTKEVAQQVLHIDPAGGLATVGGEGFRLRNGSDFSWWTNLNLPLDDLEVVAWEVTPLDEPELTPDDLYVNSDAYPLPEAEDHDVVEIDDPVTRPSHYTAFKIEPVTFIMVNDLPFHTGNIIKYVCRAGLKLYDGLNAEESEIRDLEKGIRYAEMRINQIKSAKVVDLDAAEFSRAL